MELGRTVRELRESIGQHEYVLLTRYFARKAQRQELENLRAGA